MTDNRRLIERPEWDSSGMERIPFDGRTPARPSSRIRSRQSRGKHGPGCSSNPEIGCVCGYDPGEDPAVAPADGYVRAAKLTAGQTIVIHGGVRVVVLSVESYVKTDSFEPSSRWVTLRYRWAMDTKGDTMAGKWSLPASQCLRVVG